jgi:hypothetical protein
VTLRVFEPPSGTGSGPEEAWREGRSLDFPAFDRDSNAPLAAEFRLIGLVVGPFWNSASLTQVS